MHVNVDSAIIDERVKALEVKRSRLKAAGLLEQEEPQAQLPFNVIDPNYISVLYLYLDDVTAKLEAFDSILEKIEIFRTIVNAHFSFKTLFVSKEGFSIRTSSGDLLELTRLSSGEQHLLVLVYEMLFTDKARSLILLDEPEISLHVEWQLAFLEDLQKITAVASHQVLIATHSPQIVNDRLELLSPFGQPTVAPQPVAM